jgi:hypothetical protein
VLAWVDLRLSKRFSCTNHCTAGRVAARHVCTASEVDRKPFGLYNSTCGHGKHVWSMSFHRWPWNSAHEIASMYRTGSLEHLRRPAFRKHPCMAMRAHRTGEQHATQPLKSRDFAETGRHSRWHTHLAPTPWTGSHFWLTLGSGHQLVACLFHSRGRCVKSLPATGCAAARVLATVHALHWTLQQAGCHRRGVCINSAFSPSTVV